MNGSEVSKLPALSPPGFLYDNIDVDAKLFHHLETWAASHNNLSSTHFLYQFEVFQRHMTTAAYKIVANDDLPSRSAKPTVVPQVFITKITKAFVDTIYAFINGLAFLASEEASPLVGSAVAGTQNRSAQVSLHRLIDVRDMVFFSFPFLLLQSKLKFGRRRATACYSLCPT